MWEAVMSFRKRLTAAALGMALSVGAASAATVIYEGGGPGIQPGAAAPDVVMGDFGRNPASEIINVTGNTIVYGGILHRNARLYQDAWTFDFGTGIFDVVFDFFRTTASYNGLLTVNGTDDYALNDAGTINLGSMSGSATFLIDATAAGQPRQRAHWSVTVAAVPLPAGGLLLLGGLGGLAMMRRRQFAKG